MGGFPGRGRIEGAARSSLAVVVVVVVFVVATTAGRTLWGQFMVSWDRIPLAMADHGPARITQDFRRLLPVQSGAKASCLRSGRTPADNET